MDIAYLRMHQRAIQKRMHMPTQKRMEPRLPSKHATQLFSISRQSNDRG